VAAYCDDNKIAYGTSVVHTLQNLGVCVSHVLSHIVRDGVMSVVSTYAFSHSRELVSPTKWHQFFYIHHADNHKTPNIQLVDLIVIVHHSLMAPYDNTHSSYHEIWSQELWGNAFNDCS
jgi:hypothetical protein